MSMFDASTVVKPYPLMCGNQMEYVNPRSPSGSNPRLKAGFVPSPRCLSEMTQTGIEPAS
ncbi:hypothetical protein HanHA300_Chr17g0673981 [Helianthus annuus]|nr:hypothetical protein HanHA300_Chr17g0673981 [Helianthus annuus]KAJ0449324.1 hypothetical protein HanHA89_Chr17g0727171 [Helianthus annuus]